MDRSELLAELSRALPIEVATPPLPAGNLGLIVVDVVRGFTRQGALSDPASMAPMVARLDALARELDRRLGRRLRVLLLRDSHAADIPEPPYPPHCVRGTGEDELDPGVAWLADHPGAVVIDKDCINGFVGAMRPAGDGLWRNELIDWVRANELSALLLVGDCTDICVSDLAVTLLSARNHGQLTTADPADRAAHVGAITSMPILVHLPACATFDVDPDGPIEVGPETLRHPGPVAQHVGAWLMASRGAQLIEGFADPAAPQPR